MDYIFRKAEIQDFKEVTALYREAINNMIENQIFQWDEIYPNDEVLLEDIIKDEMYLLIENNKLVACVVINEDQDDVYQSGSWRYTEGKVAVIHRLCVHPQSQGSGNGKRMMQYTEALIKEKGYPIIRLDAFPQNAAAIRLYLGLGFHLAGEVHFRKGLFNLLEKAL